jgi:hypothetical protein
VWSSPQKQNHRKPPCGVLWTTCGVLLKRKPPCGAPQHRDCAGQGKAVQYACAERQDAGRRWSCAARRALSEPAADAQCSRMRRPRERHAAACWQHALGHAGAHSARETHWQEQPRASLRSLSRALCAWRAIVTVAPALAVACPREGRVMAEPMRLTGRVRKLRGSAHPAPGKPSAHPRPDIRRGSPCTHCGAALTERA